MLNLISTRPARTLSRGPPQSGGCNAPRSSCPLRPRELARPSAYPNYDPLICTAPPKNLPVFKLLGPVRAAVTGAVLGRIGRFDRAQGGALMLVEVGALPQDLQANLLRVLQERELQRLA